VLDNPLLGLEAADHAEHGDFDVLEYAARSMPSFGEALHVMARYQRLMDEALEVAFTTEGDYASWSQRPGDGSRMPPAGNDYAIGSAIAFSQRNTSVYVPPVELRFMHARPAYAEVYERKFQTRVSFDAPFNTIVMHRSRLDVPMLRTSPAMATAFEAQARRIFDKLRDREGVAGRVREGLVDDLRSGPANMRATARRLGMGVATLRRRLEEEGTTFSDIVDDVRRKLAERHLSVSSPTVSEVAFLLGFSDVRAFGRAFRRWTGQSPTEYRAERLT
jgi:AraC-like DNA-binding protein